MTTFWQAFRQSAKEAALAFLWIIPPSIAGLVGGWLLWTHRYMALAAWIAVALVIALAVSARAPTSAGRTVMPGEGDALEAQEPDGLPKRRSGAAAGATRRLDASQIALPSKWHGRSGSHTTTGVYRG